MGYTRVSKVNNCLLNFIERNETEDTDNEEFSPKCKKLRGEEKALSYPSIISIHKGMMHADFYPATRSENVPDITGIVKQRHN